MARLLAEEIFFKWTLLIVAVTVCIHTVWAPIELQGSIFQNKFLGGVQFIFDLPGVVIKTGFYYLISPRHPFYKVSIS